MSAGAGCRVAEVLDDGTGATFPMLVMYPSPAPERPERVGPYDMSVAMDGPVEDGSFPLVVVSHGTGGSHLLYRTLAAHLARHGFVVALPEHPRNHRNDNALAGTHTILADRPRHLRAAIDWAYADGALGPRLAPRTVAVVGHSLGGYTALALAGGTPTAFGRETPDGQPRPVPVTPDARVKALVLLAPATPWFMAPGALRDVRVPILMFSAEKDEHAPLWHARIVERGVRDGTPIDHRTVANAGHYSFLAPFPPAIASPAFPPSQDPPGFDRAAFHEELNVEVEAFLHRVLLPRARAESAEASPGGDPTSYG
ncbi:MAG: putative lipoprotein signal peptide [Gemmatimonadetes bacterium]|nr:putative lipoprotein signal peptide [Gemmatimonadota bacterium]